MVLNDARKIIESLHTYSIVTVPNDCVVLLYDRLAPQLFMCAYIQTVLLILFNSIF
jgi:hypothetical protein